jgi:hypothetical protein
MAHAWWRATATLQVHKKESSEQTMLIAGASLRLFIVLLTASRACIE